MDNKKIPTLLGTIVIIIIAVTVGVFVWKYEAIKNQGDAEMQSRVVESVKPVEEKQNQQKEENQEPIDTTNWKICKNEKANYEFKYPSDWLIVDNYRSVLQNCYDSSNPRSTGFSTVSDPYKKAPSFGISTSTQKDLKGTIYEGSNSLDSYYSKNAALLNSRTKINSIEINGERSDWFKEKDGKISIWFFHNNTLYEIRSDVDKQVLESIIRTFFFPNN